MTESDYHLAAKDRVKKILVGIGYDVVVEDYMPTPAGRMDGEELPYRADLHCVNEEAKRDFIVEIDWKMGHRGRVSRGKNINRDKDFQEHRKLKTYRISLEWVVKGWNDSHGKRHEPWSDAELLEFLEIGNT